MWQQLTKFIRFRTARCTNLPRQLSHEVSVGAATVAMQPLFQLRHRMAVLGQLLRSQQAVHDFVIKSLYRSLAYFREWMVYSRITFSMIVKPAKPH